MPKASPNSDIRISLRSLFAITLGLSLIMAAASPYLRGLDSERQRHALIGMLLFCFAGILSTANSIRLRKRALSDAGEILASLSILSPHSLFWFRWLWLLFFMPIPFVPWLFFTLTTQLPAANEFFFQVPAVAFLLFNSWAVSRIGLQIWTDQGGNEIDFCKRGIVLFDRYFDWSSPKISQLKLLRHSNRLILNLKGFRKVFPLSVEDKEHIKEILDTYYQPPNTSSPFDE